MATATVSDGVSGFDILRILSPGAHKSFSEEEIREKLSSFEWIDAKVILASTKLFSKSNG